jgi:hypothetical protein
VQVTFDANPTTANAGPAQEVCSLSATLAGNTPSVGVGTWSKVSGPGTVNFTNIDAHTPGATAVVSVAGVYLLRWTIHNGSCPDSTSDVQVTFDGTSTTANAGPDQEICSLSTTLAGNAPSSGVGTWTQVSGPGTVSFTNVDAHSPNPTATASVAGVYTLRWTIHNGTCPDSTDNVQVTFDANPTPADAGANQELCGLMTVLNGNTPTVGTGTWTQTSGPGSAMFSPNNHTPGATVSVTAVGTYVFTWTIHNGACPDSMASVQVTFDASPTTANAGGNQEVCSLSAILAGNMPTVGVGTWTQTSGPGTATFSPSSNTPGATATVTAFGTYVFTWTIHNGNCPDSMASAQVTFDANPTTANAGADQEVCSLSAILAGNTPTVGTGTWSQVSGPGTVNFTNVDAHSPNATATASVAGVYLLRWTIHNGNCPDSTSDVQVTFDASPTTANAGPDQELCGMTATLNGNTPTVGTGTWTKVSGPGNVTFGPNATTPGATATVTAFGTYVFQWTIHNATCPDSTDTVQVIFDNCQQCTTTSSIASNFNGTSISPSNYIWFNANFNASGIKEGTTISFTNSTISVVKGGVTYPVSVPSSTITFSASYSCASTTWNGSQWVTTVPLSGSDEIFLSGLLINVAQITTAVDLKASTVTWQGDFSTNTAGISLNWKWGAAVYQGNATVANAAANPNNIQVKPTHTNACGYKGSDHAGTPENNAIQKSVIGGARGGGGSNFTGSWSGTQSVAPCINNPAGASATSSASSSAAMSGTTTTAATSNVCPATGSLRTLTMTYEGLNIGGGTVAGNPGGLDAAYIVVSGASSSTLFSGAVSFNSSTDPNSAYFVIDAGKNRTLPAQATVTIYTARGGAKVSTVTFDTSCKQPLNVGDYFGSLRVSMGSQ